VQNLVQEMNISTSKIHHAMDADMDVKLANTIQSEKVASAFNVNPHLNLI
jgi:hypothetical protein